ncbi:DNA-binding transcriptional regulator, Lrp family [Streptoalloteichus tenebrarius]|uniref:DNA-binding transcriptional regulator, Lrp family n=1 Tax=Streptoalloteichus tenebrarius (strain ATCC 17920 / DSM 40477 / JCM 4838 / CBS 697.72 / NBRC 16177 / NCIMB 11028 / NRRL B-12390 / A12253. 1 / ISP 5477) TaxID=1933 RepID=A0ABT1HM50_STRSD|nr:Lrp/AsnC family transcriptional regulator [Streptoalloteichus tenebrarius]MCP2256570.1 DNA-binding transcriptional regulator, Lrp family [Streptoalloteichus tenebrarius]BFF04922.1 AsnC family transcriptional regulator [Streptoalloteichus tenebrarius]
MLDELDRGLIHALHVDGRVPFSRVAEVLGVSTQTVTRRYRRLRVEAGLRVVGLADPARAGEVQWMVRLTTTPATAQALAHSLARRPDTSWVKLTSGGTEIFTIVHAPRGAEPSRSLLLHDIPRRSGITAVSAHCLLHTYLGGPTAWSGRLRALSEEQRERLRPDLPPAGEDMPLTSADHDLVNVLRHDGRASYADLAAATGWSQATVARRLADLRARGVVFFDVEVDSTAFGVGTQALLWMRIAPAHLDHVGTVLATHPELAAVVATTGPTNLLAQALCSDPADLHRYLTRGLGGLDQILSIETAPVLHTLKATGHLLPVATPPSPPAHRRRP